jgi:CheY-like chemotaxis protein
MPGKELLPQMQAKKGFSAVIFDLQRHEPNVTAALESLQVSYPEVPMVLLTPREQRKVNGLSEQPPTVVSKPIRPSLLYDALINVIDGRSNLSPRPAPTTSEFDITLAEQYPLKILLAEDNLVNQKVALRILSKQGYRADVAGNGREVLESIDRQPYDVILMDVNMPEMDGMTATRRIRSERPPDQTPYIVAVTANAMQGDREQYLAAGMDDYISKPIRIEELTEALIRAFNLKSKKEI